jgi:hypothetical protein
MSTTGRSGADVASGIFGLVLEGISGEQLSDDVLEFANAGLIDTERRAQGLDAQGQRMQRCALGSQPLTQHLQLVAIVGDLLFQPLVLALRCAARGHGAAHPHLLEQAVSLDLV